jgi:putative transposase
MAQRAFKYRVYPTDTQVALLSRQFGSVRQVWNLGLSVREDTFKETGLRATTNDLMKMLPLWKEEFPWLTKASDVVLQQTLRDQDQAFTNFFDGLSGKRPRMGFPRFKARATARKSVRYTKNGFRYRNGHIYLAKTQKPLPIEWSRPLPSDAQPSSVTVSLDASGRWHISILCDMNINHGPSTGAMVGIDLGIKTFAVLSDGEDITHPKLLAKKEARLKRYQRRLSRCEKGSNNRNKARIKVAKQHAKVADARRDFLHKTTTELVRTYDVIAIENLSVANMVKNHKLAKSISDSSWGVFRTMLEYKAKWYGKQVVVIDRFHPSSKLCNNCQWKNNELTLSQREWVCKNCGTLLDRDVNAAKNILDAGLVLVQQELNKACGEDVRPKKSPRVTTRKSRQPSLKQEPTENAAQVA